MVVVPKRPQRLAVALPATFTMDIPHLREKTSRIGLVARALSIFRAEEAIIYPDVQSREATAEAKLVEKIIRFQETPQYLRRYLFPRDTDLSFAGTLPPLRAPHHPNRLEPSLGQVRDGIVISTGPVSKVNAGYRDPVNVRGKLDTARRVTIRIDRVGPSLWGELVDPTELTIYWGFKVSRDNTALGRIIERGEYDLTISTSRQGRDVRDVLPALRARWNSSRSPLVAFGSPREGIPEILARSNSHISKFDFNLNTIPVQGVETVRTEEALLATLTTLNLLEGL